MSWTYEQCREYLVDALRREAQAQEVGRVEEVGAAFDELDANLPRNAGPEFDKLHMALNFWDSWIDARNHEWHYHDAIETADWPRLARTIADLLAANEEITDPLLLENFGVQAR